MKAKNIFLILFVCVLTGWQYVKRPLIVIRQEAPSPLQQKLTAIDSQLNDDKYDLRRYRDNNIIITENQKQQQKIMQDGVTKLENDRENIILGNGCSK